MRNKRGEQGLTQASLNMDEFSTLLSPIDIQKNMKTCHKSGQKSARVSADTMSENREGMRESRENTSYREISEPNKHIGNFCKQNKEKHKNATSIYCICDQDLPESFTGASQPYQ